MNRPIGIEADVVSCRIVERRRVAMNVADCPFFIMMPEHFRDDGTCRCDDPAHRATMKEWGYSVRAIQQGLKGRGR